MIQTCDSVVIFGGSGYIAGYTLNYLVEHELAQKIYLIDIKSPRTEVWTTKTHSLYDQGRLIFINMDVRNPIDLDATGVDCIFNYAAIHREPGHEPAEYFETNIKGADHVVAFAEKTGCKQLIFTSSIAPYGHAEVARTEQSQVVPYSPYGSSKLVAEKIHEAWRSRDAERYLVIVRPGVIYGPHEDGNVPRLKNALKRGLFCYVGNKSVRKSGGYVKELVSSIFWTMNWAHSRQQHSVLYNFSFPEPPELERYVDAIKTVGGYHKPVPVIPYALVIMISYVLLAISKPLGVSTPAHPERVKKLRVDNQIIPQFLIDESYPYKYDLVGSLEDWKSDTPDEW